jgi:hypothetical protein
VKRITEFRRWTREGQSVRSFLETFSMRKTLLPMLAALALSGLGLQTAAAQTVRDHRTGSSQPAVRDHRGETPPPEVGDHRQGQPAPPVVRDHRTSATTARFVVLAVRLYANDESGPDFAGSDEVFIEFHDLAGGQRQWAQFDEFDTGEARAFPRSQSCIAPIVVVGRHPSCESAGAPGPVRFDVDLHEIDRTPIGGCVMAGIPGLGRLCAQRLGRATIALAPDTLVAELPQAGRYTLKTVRLGGYTLTYRVERVQ